MVGVLCKAFYLSGGLDQVPVEWEQNSRYKKLATVCNVIVCELYYSRDGQVVRLLNLLSDGCGLEPQSRPVIKVSLSTLCNSRQKGQRNHEVRSH